MEIFKLFGSILIDDKQAIDAMNGIDKKADDTSKNGLSKLVDSANNVGKTLVAIGAGVAAGATALVALGEKSANAAFSIKKLSAQTQLSTDDTQEWAYVFQKLGSSTDTMSSAINKLGITMGKADDENKRAKEAFKELGINIEGTGGKLKSSGTLFDEAMTKLAGMKDATERNILAQKLFGGNYQELIPIMNKGSSGIEELKNKAKELGLVMSTDEIAAGSKYKLSMADLKEELGSVGTRIGNDLLPYFGKFADWLNKNEPKIKEFIDKTLKVLGDTIAFVSKNGNTFAAVLGTVFAGIMALNAIKTIQEVMIAWNTVVKVATAVQKAWNLAMETNPIGLFVALIVGLIAIVVTLYTKCDWFRNGLIAIFDAIKQYFTGVVFPVWQAYLGVVTGVFKSILSSTQSVIGNIKNIFSNLISFVKNVFTGNWRGAWQNIVNIFKNVFGAVSTIWKAPINAIISGINGFINGIDQIKIPDWVPGVGGKGINIPHIPMLAQGGNITQAGRVLVGEKGPEFLDLPQGARVTPLEKAGTQQTFHIDKFIVQDKGDERATLAQLQFLAAL